MSLLSKEESINQLHNDITRTLQVFPYTSQQNGITFNVTNVKFLPPDDSYEAQQDALDKDKSLETRISATITATKDGENVVSPLTNTIIGVIPRITERGTYIQKGNEMLMLNRMSLRPGVYTHRIKPKKKSEVIESEVRTGKVRFLITFDTVKPSLTVNNLTMEFGRSTKPGVVNAFALLRILGATDEEIRQAVGDDALYMKLKADKSGNSSLDRIYTVTHASKFPGEVKAKDTIQHFFNHDLAFDNSAQEVNKATIGTGYDHFTKDAFLDALRKMFQEYRQPGVSPNVDDQRFKQVSTGEDLIAEGFAQGIDQWIKTRLNTFDAKKDREWLRPRDIVDKSIGAKTRTNEGGLAELADIPNPLALFQAKQKVTVLGGGGLTTQSASNENRNLQDTAFAKIDPIETPQSINMGLIQHFAKDVKVKNGRILSSFYRVKNGEIDKSHVIDTLDPLQEYEEYIAFNDPRQIDQSTTPWRLKGSSIRVRHHGEFIQVPPSQVTLIDKSPTSVFGYASALIPFGPHNDGARMLMGANMQSQAMALQNPEAPLVQSYADDTDKTMEQVVADKASFLLRSPVDGTVKAIRPNSIDIEGSDGNVQKVDKLNYFATGKMGGYINHVPVVKVGDTVKAGDLLADGWQSKNGQLALGKNTLVAYMPFEGYNFEDGVAVSQSWADKMASEELKTLEYEFKPDVIVGDPEAMSLMRKLNPNNAVLSKLDADGIIKKGQKISAGDLLVAAVRRKKDADISGVERTLNALVGKFSTGSVQDQYEWQKEGLSKFAEGYQKGEVIEVRKLRQPDGGFKVTIKMLAFKPMQTGDKLAGRHGNKGTITKIVPDDQMPRTKDGRVIDLIFSPLAVPSRKNLGQLHEVNAGLVAMHKGLPVYKVRNFDPDARKQVDRELDEIGIPGGKMDLINPATGKPYENKVTVGPMYIMKLKHKVESKITGRSYGATDKIDKVLQAPKKVSGSIDGERHNPQGVGGMEFWSLTSAGAVHNIHEMTTLKSDGVGDKKARFDLYQALRKGTKIVDPVTPGSLKALRDTLYGAGLEMTPLNGDNPVSWDEHFNALSLQPMTKATRDRLQPTEVETAKGMEVSKDSEAKGGLYDPDIFGPNEDKWGSITLAEPLPNPLFMDRNGPRPYEAMLAYKGIKHSQLERVVKQGDFIVLDPKDSGLDKYKVLTPKEVADLEDEGKEFTAQTGGQAIRSLLNVVDMKEAFRYAENQLKNPPGKNAKAQLEARSKAEKHVRVLSNALDHKLTPDDFLLHYIPVLPTKYRPIIRNGPRSYTEDGINKLYISLMNHNTERKRVVKALDENPDMTIDPSLDSKDQLQQYKWVEHIIGVGDPYIDKTRGKNTPWLGVMHRLKGKSGLLRENMQKKLQDYSGRSVITVDPTLNLDEVGLPEDLAVETFKPFVQKELEQMRFSPSDIKQILSNPMDKKYRNEFKIALENAVQDKPVILNRQPSLHRHSMQAFWPKLRWNEDKRPNLSIGLNPLVTTGFNADFDGDTMPVHLPLTPEARNEAITKLMPSENLLNPTNNRLIMELKHEMQLGIYYMTREKPLTGTPKKFKSFDDMMKAYNKGEVSTYDPAELNVPPFGPKVATVGQHIFNWCLPESMRDYQKNVDINDDKLEELLTKIIHGAPPKLGPAAAVDAMNKLRNLSFRVSTYSGMSIGTKDFQGVEELDRDKLMQTAVDRLKAEKADKYVSGMKDLEMISDEEKTRKAKEILENIIKGKETLDGKEVLDKDNPVKIMMASGARGNAGQINAMAGIIGVGKSVTNQATRPVLASHLEGLSPDQFWDLSYDSRKGIFDKSIATRDPGALTRQIWMANKQTIISEKDCGDTQGISLDMSRDVNRKALRGKVLLSPVQLKHGGIIPVTGAPISLADFERAKTEAEGTVRVRSPLTCKAKIGICQLCYGARAGSMQNQLVPIGEAVGSIAAQAIGEPSQQAIMKTFHTGAGNSTVSDAFSRIKEVLSATKSMNKATQAVLAEKGGFVTKIENDPDNGMTVYVDQKPYHLGKKPIADGIEEKVKVEPGDLLTKEKEYDTKTGIPEYFTFRDPREVLKYKGPEEAQKFLVESLEDALKLGGAGNTDHRHLEVIVHNMMGRAKVDDAGTSPFMAGRTVSQKAIRNYNTSAQMTRAVTMSMDYASRPNVIGSIAAMSYPDQLGRRIVDKGQPITEDVWNKLSQARYRNIKVVPKLATAVPVITGVEQSQDTSDPDWLSNAAYEDAVRTIGTGAAYGSVDKLNNPLTRQMAGLKGNFSDAFSHWKDKLDSLTHGFL